MPDRFRALLLLTVSAAALGCIIWAVSVPLGKLPALGLFIDVWHGAYATARQATEPATLSVSIDALSAPVKVLRDERGVPHIFAQNDFDAVMTLGYLTARDRLFQMDIQTRLASGRLAEALGAEQVERDKYLRRTGMMWGAERSWEAVQKATDSTSKTMKKLLEAYTAGVNAYIASLRPTTFPFEFRLLGYAPEAWTPLKTILINQLMAFDLCFTIQTTDVKFAALAQTLDARYGAGTFAALYPDHSPMPEPYSPEPKGVLRSSSQILGRDVSSQTQHLPQQEHRQALPFHAMQSWKQAMADIAGIYAEPSEGKGSNNWVVAGAKTRSGKPLLAGDPHLNLSMPSIWYEAHLHTPAMDVYGVTIPGAPLIIIGFNDAVAWSPTNTGADVLDFYAIEFETAAQQRYKYQGKWETVREEVRPIRVKGRPDVPDTVRFTRWGPVITQHKQTLSIRWTAHEPSTILEAIWGFNHAKGWRDFSEAQKKWDVPAQNIVFADREGNIAIRSCGHYPIRKRGDGKFIFDGATSEGEWIDRVPFDSVPASLNPARNWLSSANQEPVPPDYPYYMGYNWPNPFRGKRIGEVLKSSSHLAPEDFQKLQTDVQSQQFHLMRSTMQRCGATESITDSLKKQAVERLLAWDGVTSKDSRETLLFKLFWDEFTRETWDELPDSLAGEPPPIPPQDVLCDLVQHEPDSKWFDHHATPVRETAITLCKQALKQATDSLIAKYGTEPSGWAWGKHHSIVMRHLLRVESVKPLWRGPFPFQGFSSTVLPAGGMQTTHSASWRMVADFANGAPQGYGVFPGGPSGNPFSAQYGSQVQDWLDGKLYKLYKPASTAAFERSRCTQELTVSPR
jgi:penicillin amidase